MSEQIKHECGVALVRLLKPLEYYELKYGTWMHGLQKLYLLMEKQHNRGQDGAGVAAIKLDLEPGNKYLFRQRSTSANPINNVFKKLELHHPVFGIRKVFIGTHYTFQITRKARLNP